MDASIALDTFFRIKTDLLIRHGQGALRAVFHTDTTVFAESPRLRIMAVLAVNITALQKDCRPVSRTIHAAERDDPVDYRFHQSNW